MIVNLFFIQLWNSTVLFPSFVSKLTQEPFFDINIRQIFFNEPFFLHENHISEIRTILNTTEFIDHTSIPINICFLTRVSADQGLLLYLKLTTTYVFPTQIPTTKTVTDLSTGQKLTKLHETKNFAISIKCIFFLHFLESKF